MMERLTFDGNFCDIAMCTELRYGSLCPDGACTQRKVWEQLKAYEDNFRFTSVFDEPKKTGDVLCIVQFGSEKRYKLGKYFANPWNDGFKDRESGFYYMDDMCRIIRMDYALLWMMLPDVEEVTKETEE